MATAESGIMVSGNAGICEIKYNPRLFSPDGALIHDTKKKIADTGLRVGLDYAEFGSGVLTLIVEEIRNVGNAIIDIIKYIVGRIKASAVAV